MKNKKTDIMIVLPPKEGYSPDQVGAIGLLVKTIAQSNDLIVGQEFQSKPFMNGHYIPVKHHWYSWFNKNKAYLYGIIRLIKHYSPLLVEVHNRPEIALILTKKFPNLTVSLILHNDPLMMRGLKTKTERQDLMKFVHVVVVSDWLKKRFLSGIAVGQVSVLPNYIDLKKIPLYIPIHERDKTILFVGRIVADKGADLFIRICRGILKENPSWQVMLIGADRFSKTSKETLFMKKLQQDIGCVDMKMVGYLKHEEVLQYMARATMVMMPSRWEEPFGMTALEAMACGTPSLVSSRGALPQVVGDAAVVIEPEEIDQNIIIAKQLLNDKQEQENLSKKALAQVLQYDAGAALERLNQFRRYICPNLSI